MAIVDGLTDLVAEMRDIRRDIHMNPEIAFEEEQTSDLVASFLERNGLTVHRGLAGTGVVGTLKVGSGDRRIGLRADMDALHIEEANTFAHRSKVPGKMHACGHDGHTAMLLGAAKHLARTQDFQGTVDFIFQPAEENEGGGRKMIEDGLFDLFPVDMVFGLHNKPGLPIGQFGIRPGPMLASYDIFEFTVSGEGTHAALPYSGVDTIGVAGALIGALQSLVRNTLHPADPAVVSVTQIHGGETWNVIPASVKLGGTVRCYSKESQDRIERAMGELATSFGVPQGAGINLRYERRYPPTINPPHETEIAARVASQIVGGDNINRNLTPAMGAEDFSFMLGEKPGAFMYVGNGESEDGRYLHNARYDFNDDALIYGASYWVRLVETLLSPVEQAKQG